MAVVIDRQTAKFNSPPKFSGYTVIRNIDNLCYTVSANNVAITDGSYRCFVSLSNIVGSE